MITVAQATVNFALAYPQGWTKEAVEERLNDLLTELSVDERSIVSYDISFVRVNADPFAEKTTYPTAPTTSAFYPTTEAQGLQPSTPNVVPFSLSIRRG